MRMLVAIVVLLWVTSTTQAQNRVVVGRDITVFHADAVPNSREIELLEPNKMNDYDMRAMALLMGIEVSRKPSEVPDLPFVTHRAPDIKNGLAGISISEGNRIPRRMRFVIYDPHFFGDASEGVASRYMVLGHEIGHHACGHTEGSRTPNNWKRELEADQYAGAALRRLERLRPAFNFQKELPSIRASFSMAGSRSHPPAEQRLEAILLGYRSGSPCDARKIELYVR
jgi:hypothetical protein